MRRSLTKTLLFVSIVLFWFAQYVYVPYQTPYLISLGATSALAGIVVGAYGFSQMLLRIPVGIAANRTKQKTFIILGNVCAAASSLLRLLIPSPEAFLAANLITGIASSMWISFTVFCTSLYDEKELKQATGYAVAASNAGVLLGFSAGALLSGSLGIKFVFIASIVAGAAALVCSLFLAEERRPAGTLTFQGVISAFKSKTLIFHSLLGALFQAVILSTALSFTMNYLKEMTSDEVSLGISSIIFMAASTAASYMITRTKKMNTRLLLCVLFACLAVYCIFVPLSAQVWQLYILQLIIGIGNGGIMPLLMEGALKGSTADRPVTMGFFQAVYGVGMTLGPALMGAVIGAAGYAAGYWILAAFPAVCIAALLIVRFEKS